MRIAKPSENIEEICTALKGGEIVMISTDTVMGLICDYHNKKAEAKIFKLKKRPEDKILSIFVSSIDEVKKIVSVDARQEKFLNRVWPGKITCVLKKEIGGFRIPDDKFLLDILKKFDGPLFQTSANISGAPPIGGGLPSTVVDLTEEKPKILREGAVSGAELQKIWDMIS